MGAEVHNIFENTPHLAGEAVCLVCKFSWVAVSPVGVAALQCPSCETFRGCFIGAPELPDRTAYVCNCGCAMFKVLPGLRAHCLIEP